MKLKLFTVSMLAMAVATTVALSGCRQEETQVIEPAPDTTMEQPEVTEEEVVTEEETTVAPEATEEAAPAEDAAATEEAPQHE